MIRSGVSDAVVCCGDMLLVGCLADGVVRSLFIPETFPVHFTTTLWDVDGIEWNPMQSSKKRESRVTA